MDDIINDIKSVKELMEKRFESSRACDSLLKIFLTSEEIEEISKLRKKQEEYINRMADIMDFAIYGYSDKLVEDPDFYMISLELSASSIISDDIESKILNIYAAVKRRLVG